jgi:hypothetical protein
MNNITVLRDFFDGTLAEEFEKLGYPAKWKAGEKRNLPNELVTKVTRSGGQIAIADAGAKESRLTVGAEPVTIDAEQHYTDAYHKAPRITVLFPEGFKDGALTDELAALGHPAEFGVCEIASLPRSMIEKIVISGGTVETDSEAIGYYRSQQAKHQKKVNEWREERARQRQASLKRRESAEHNKGVQAKIEELSARAVNATGKTKEALWKRIDELYGQVQ